MFKLSLKSISILFKFARNATIVKILQCIVTAILTPLSLYFTQNLFDSIEAYVNGVLNIWDVILWIVLLLISLLFLSSNSFWDSILFIFLQRNMNKNLTPVIIKKFQNLNFACFEDKDVFDTIKRMGSSPHEKILNIFINTLDAITLLISLIGTAIIFVQVSLWFTINFILVLIPMLLIDFKAMSMMNNLLNSQSIEERKLEYLSTLLTDKFSLFELKIFGAIDYILLKWKKKNKIVLDERVKMTIISQKYFAVSTLLIILWSSIVAFFLVSSIISGKITIGIFASLIGSTGSILSMTQSLSRNFSNLSQKYLEIKHYYNFLALPEFMDNGKTNRISKPYIKFDNVFFTYPKSDKLILNGVSFEIKPNEKIALVGENGAGKSTIIKLILKLYEPNNGKITINGVDIKNLSQKQLRNVFSVVFQDYANYSFTLRENVAFGDIDKLNDINAIKSALKQGMAEDLLKIMPKGIDTNLGKLEDDGVDLSGGQWQRVAIARACIADSAFVILDEPTASLDPIAESEMYTSFSHLLEHRGCIMVSHRLASAKLADKIIIISNGKVIEQGSHGDLMKNDNLYKEMYIRQSSWYKNDEITLGAKNEQQI